MAQRRMLSMHIIDTDAFMDMPHSSQCLYLHMHMRADDDGFVANAKKIMRMVGASDDDLKILLAKRFVLPFESGVCVIKHWRIHNLIRSDRYNETKYVEEKGLLQLKDNGAYSLATSGIPDGNQMAPQVSIGKVSIGKSNIVASDERSPTPEEEAQDFFALGETYHEILTALAEKSSAESAERELQKFILYWTERNKSGTRQRWQQERTFEVKRRLYSWLARAKDASNKPKRQII